MTGAHFPARAPRPPLLWRSDPAGSWTWSCPRWTRFTGLSRGSSLGDGWLDAVHPADRRAAGDPWIAVDGSGLDRAPFRLRSAESRVYRFVHASASLVPGSDGTLDGWMGALVQGEGQGSAAPVGDLQHHMRNALAVIRSVARRTARTSDTVEHYADHFEGRLDALARVQDAVIRSPDGGVDLESLIDEEILASRVSDDRVRVSGAAVRLRARTAEVLGLALHELATNALKFGAFSAGGAVAVNWVVTVDADPPVLHLTWRETGVSPLDMAPRRRGFGTETVERGLPYDLDAVTRFEFLPGGLRCTIAFPLTEDRVVDP